MKRLWGLGFALLAQLSFAGPPQTWQSVGVGGGGAFFAPSFSPFNPNEIYVGSDMSDQFHTTDLGAHWAMTPFTQLQVGRNSPKVQFTSDPNVLYTVNFAGDTGHPVKSTVAGLLWAPLLSDPTGGDCWNIVADTGSSNRVFVSNYNQLFYSSNGGQSFSLKYSAAMGNGLHIGGSFFDGSLMLLGTNDGLLVSTDGGTTLNLVPTVGIPATEAIVSLAGAKSGSTIRLFCVTLGSGDVYEGVQGDDYGNYKGVYTINWGDASWVKRTTGIPGTAFPFFVSTARNDINTAYLAGSANGSPAVYKTTNGGSTWQSVLTTGGNANVATGWQGSGGDRDWGYAEFCFGLAVCPTDANRVAFTDYGFVHVTSNGGTVWRQAYVDQSTENPAGQPTPKGKSYKGIGLEDTTCWSVAWADANTMWASFADIRGIRSVDGGKTWSFNYTGHTLNASYQVVVQPTSGVMYMAASSIHDLYQSTYLTDARIDGGTGSVLYSTNKGQTWTALGTTITKPVIGLSLDPTNPNRLFATTVNSASGGVYVCNNINSGAGATWTKLATPPRTEGHAFNIVALKDGSLVCTYSGRRTTNFTASSGVFVSTNGGQSWQDRSHPNMVYWTKDITVDPYDPGQNTWYVAVFGGWGGQANGKGGLYRTTDRGLNWQWISTRDRIGSCTVDPKRRNELYFTTEVEGLWHSSDIRAANPTFQQVASYPFRQPERVFFNPYKASEMWVTSFGGGLRVGQTVNSLPRGH